MGFISRKDFSNTMIHNCIECNVQWECGHGNPCSDHGEKLHCDECFEKFMNTIFEANMKAGVKSEEDYLKGEYES